MEWPPFQYLFTPDGIKKSTAAILDVGRNLRAEPAIQLQLKGHPQFYAPLCDSKHEKFAA